MLLGRFDSEAERQVRRKFYVDKRRDENIRNYSRAVQLLREEGIISDQVAFELESKVEDEDGTCPLCDSIDISVHGTNHSNSLCGAESVVICIYMIEQSVLICNDERKSALIMWNLRKHEEIKQQITDHPI